MAMAPLASDGSEATVAPATSTTAAGAGMAAGATVGGTNACFESDGVAVGRGAVRLPEPDGTGVFVAAGGCGVAVGAGRGVLVGGAGAGVGDGTSEIRGGGDVGVGVLVGLTDGAVVGVLLGAEVAVGDEAAVDVAVGTMMTVGIGVFTSRRLPGSSAFAGVDTVARSGTPPSATMSINVSRWYRRRGITVLAGQ